MSKSLEMYENALKLAERIDEKYDIAITIANLYFTKVYFCYLLFIEKTWIIIIKMS